MYRNDRLDEIVNIIRDSHYISVHKLAALIHASEPTIRSKWKSLSASGIIRIQSKDGRTGVIDWDMLKMASSPAIVARLETEAEQESEKNKKTKKHTEEAIA